jgi:hypothetical protein
MANIPQAAMGSVIALLLVNRPAPSARRGVLVGNPGNLDRSNRSFGGPLGRLHHADRDRQPQRHHDDLALHSPDEVRRRGLRRADDHPRQPRAACARADDRFDHDDRLGALGPGRRPNRQGDPAPPGRRGDRRTAHVDRCWTRSSRPPCSSSSVARSTRRSAKRRAEISGPSAPLHSGQAVQPVASTGAVTSELLTYRATEMSGCSSDAGLLPPPTSRRWSHA